VVRADAAEVEQAAAADSDDEEAAPLSKRRKGKVLPKVAPPKARSESVGRAAALKVPLKITTTEAAVAEAVEAALEFAYAEGDKVEAWRGAAWQPAWVENVNEEDGTFDVVFDGGGELDGVAAHLIRPRPHAAAAKANADADTDATANATKAATKATPALPTFVSKAAQAAPAPPADDGAAGGKRKRKVGAVAAKAPPPKLVPSQHDKKQASLRGFFGQRPGA